MVLHCRVAAAGDRDRFSGFSLQMNDRLANVLGQMKVERFQVKGSEAFLDTKLKEDAFTSIAPHAVAYTLVTQSNSTTI